MNEGLLDKIFAAITQERRYQNMRFGIDEHEIGQWLAIMKRELDQAQALYALGFTRNAMAGILKVLAVGVACAQQHGLQVPERPDDLYVPDQED